MKLNSFLSEEATNILEKLIKSLKIDWVKNNGKMAQLSYNIALNFGTKNEYLSDYREIINIDYNICDDWPFELNQFDLINAPLSFNINNDLEKIFFSLFFIH